MLCPPSNYRFVPRCDIRPLPPVDTPEKSLPKASSPIALKMQAIVYAFKDCQKAGATGR
jgi:hypothetical protein